MIRAVAVLLLLGGCGVAAQDAAIAAGSAAVGVCAREAGVATFGTTTLVEGDAASVQVVPGRGVSARQAARINACAARRLADAA